LRDFKKDYRRCKGAFGGGTLRAAWEASIGKSAIKNDERIESLYVAIAAKFVVGWHRQGKPNEVRRTFDTPWAAAVLDGQSG
jgi:hypothetical protein